MKKIIFLVSTLFSFSVFAEDTTLEKNVETIVIVRHAEKPDSNLGQLTCQGLNRSLLLPDYFKTYFPKPDYIFAPDPAVKNKQWSYVRPEATIEPTAIRLGLPVNTQIGFNQPAELVDHLLQDKYHSAVIYVAWEHVNIQKIARILLERFHSSVQITHWSNDDYNRVYEFKIDWNPKTAMLNFSETSEDMNNLSKECPK